MIQLTSSDHSLQGEIEVAVICNLFLSIYIECAHYDYLHYRQLTNCVLVFNVPSAIHASL